MVLEFFFLTRGRNPCGYKFMVLCGYKFIVLYGYKLIVLIDRAQPIAQDESDRLWTMKPQARPRG